VSLPRVLPALVLVISGSLSACSSPVVTESQGTWNLVWADEFNTEGPPDPANWTFETGFVRNQELQYYQAANATCTKGLLVLEARREAVANPGYVAGSPDWTQQRAVSEFTSASVTTQGRHQWKYGRFEVRARIDTDLGLWPAIWTLGVDKEWPQNGEIDLLEMYRIKDQPTILANTAWGTAKRWTAAWNSQRYPLSSLTTDAAGWTAAFHLWRMDWDERWIRIYLDDVLLNQTDLTTTVNPDGSNPFRQAHYLLLNLAVGSNGGTPADPGPFPRHYEIDYVRVYQKG